MLGDYKKLLGAVPNADIRKRQKDSSNGAKFAV